jgi:transposase-like protein
MKVMARQRSHSIAFKRQVAQEFIAGESLYALSKRHDISRQLIRVWVEKYEAGALDEDAGPIYSRNTKPRLQRWSAWLADKRSKLSS